MFFDAVDHYMAPETKMKRELSTLKGFLSQFEPMKNLMLAKRSKKIIRAMKQSGIIKQVKGIKINVLDKGG